MWLVLCSSSDASAHWAFQGLLQMGLAPLQLVTAESLASARAWEHHVNSSGAHVTITLANGAVIRSSQIRGVLNRLVAPSDFTARCAVDAYRQYAAAETQAFYLSWLHALPGAVINRPAPLGLSGPWFHASEWTLRASRAGLRTCTYRQSARDSAAITDARRASFSRERTAAHHVIALHGEIFGAQVPSDVAHACGRLAKAANTRMLGLQLNSREGDEWTFADATVLPDLRAGGVPLLRRMAQILVTGEPS
ncbi:hypothetical protein ACFPT7_01685 [Acidicapsa dinghuensis]|uniref:Uncharacterized protein n=1 Tax=Acidicapsa dinghuensis TaxID=2218256 RepID=A0ABW1EDE1_9BACT|nr:hypothetical protein [Acidicapsa dinghuensis]